MFESQEGLMLSRYDVICAEYPCTSLVWHTVCSGFVRPSPIIWLGTFSLSVCLWLQLKQFSHFNPAVFSFHMFDIPYIVPSVWTAFFFFFLSLPQYYKDKCT